MNNVVLMGRLTNDVVITHTKGDNPMAIGKFAIAVDKKIKKEGELSANFINCVVFGKTAENIGKFFQKGNMICINGSIETGSYTDKDGNKKYTTDIHVNNFSFTGEKKSTGIVNTNEDFSVDTDDDNMPF